MDADKVREFYAVAVYSTDRVYGGPEEGGWWYTAGELEYVHAFYHHEEVAWEAARTLNEEFKPEFRYAGNMAAHVVTVPRWELKPEYAAEACHGYGSDELYDEHWKVRPEYGEWRTDVPLYFPEYGQHYC